MSRGRLSTIARVSTQKHWQSPMTANTDVGDSGRILQAAKSWKQRLASDLSDCPLEISWHSGDLSLANFSKHHDYSSHSTQATLESFESGS